MISDAVSFIYIHVYIQINIYYRVLYKLFLLQMMSCQADNIVFIDFYRESLNFYKNRMYVCTNDSQFPKTLGRPFFITNGKV